MSRHARRPRRTWKIIGTRTSGRTTDYTLSVLGKRDRPIIVSGRRKDDRIALLCLTCRSASCDHARFVSDTLQVFESTATSDEVQQRIARMFAEPPPQERHFPLAGAHFGKRMCDVPRDELHRGWRYYTNPLRAWQARSKEIVQHIDGTIAWIDAQRSTDFSEYPAALRDDPDEVMPWDKPKEE